MVSVVVNEDVLEGHRRIRKQLDRIDRVKRAGLDVAGLVAELRALEESLAHLLHHREILARSVA